MPRDFNTFINEHKKTIEENPTDVEKYKEIIDKYKDLNSNELMSNLLSEASKLKKEGKLDPNMLEGLKTSLTPFLNEDQKSALTDLITVINKQN